jgi:sulfofructose kinase
MAEGRLLCVGALTQDTIFRLERLPDGPGKFLPLEAVQIAAGMASSAAASAARQGGTVSLWASIGDDPTGQDLLAELRSESVDCCLVRQVTDGRSAISTIFVDAQGERIIVPFYHPVTQADPEGLPCPDFSAFDAVLVDVRWPGAARLALMEAQRCGIPAILDADVGPKRVLEDLSRLATHIVASLPAAEILCGTGVGQKEAVTTLHQRFGGVIAVTDGAAGTSFCESEDGRVRHVPAPKIVPVDTLAAGDVFHGSFALGLAQGLDLEPAIAWASAAAAIKCQRFGGRLGAPTRAEILDFLAQREPPALNPQPIA